MKTAVSQILTIYRSILLPHAEGVQYAESWGPDFVKKNADRSHEQARDIKVDFSEMTSEEATLLGFPLWDESGLRLIPLWLWDNMAMGQSLTCIDGVSTFVHADYKDNKSENYLDNDHRAGATAYGFMPLDLRIGQVDEPAAD